MVLVVALGPQERLGDSRSGEPSSLIAFFFLSLYPRRMRFYTGSVTQSQCSAQAPPARVDLNEQPIIFSPLQLLE